MSLIPGGGWAPTVCIYPTHHLAPPPYVPATIVGPLGPNGGGNMSLIFWGVVLTSYPHNSQPLSDIAVKLWILHVHKRSVPLVFWGMVPII